MAKSVTLTLGYSGTTFKRNFKIEGISDELTNSAIVANIKAVNASLTGDNAATQINKLLAIGGLSIVADASMKRITTEEVVDNG